MPAHAIFESVRQQLQQGETGGALDTLIKYLESEGKQTELLRTLRVVQANYNAAKQQELKGILAFQEAQREYSKVNDALLRTLDDLHAGRPTNTAFADVGRRVPWIWVGLGLALLAVVGAFFIFGKPNTPKKETTAATCPEFRKVDYRIMIIPFLSLSGDTVIHPSVSIQARIRQLTTNNKMSTDVELAPGPRITSLPDWARAEQKGKYCGADLVIWGQFEKVDDSLQIDVHYVFTKGDQLPGHTDFQPFKSLTALQKSGKSSGLRTLDDAVLSLCSVLAVHANRPEVAEKWLGKIQDTSEKDDSLMDAITLVKQNQQRSNVGKKASE